MPDTRDPIYASIRDQRAVISGGSRGIGRAIALRLAREGAHVAVTYARSSDAAEETAEACRALGVEAAAWKADIGNEDEVRALFHQLEDWQPGGGAPGIDIFVNNAARGLERPRPALS